jgi:putative hydrolase of the HAD superfamily
MQTLILDCDNTLYRNDDLFVAVGNRIIEFMISKLDFSRNHVNQIRKEYWKKYGTTLAGLIRDTDVDPYEYLNYVHDIQLPDYIMPNPGLKSILKSMKMDVYVMSNAPRFHVDEVLDILDINDIPLGVYTIEDFSFNGKPFESAYRRLLEESRLNAKDSIMVDDNTPNLLGAKRVGMHTCLVGKPDGYSFDYEISDISRIGEITHR